MASPNIISSEGFTETVIHVDGSPCYTFGPDGLRCVPGKGGIGGPQGKTLGLRTCHTGNMPAVSTGDGVNVTDNVANTIYLAEIPVPWNGVATGISLFKGTAVAGNCKVMLYDSTGLQLGISASTAVGSATVYLRIPFLTPVTLWGPDVYYVGAIYDTTTHDLRGLPSNLCNTGTFTTGVTYASPPTQVTLPTTPGTAGHGPIASLY